MTDVNSSLMKEFLNITLAERKAVVKPQSITNHAQREGFRSVTAPQPISVKVPEPYRGRNKVTIVRYIKDYMKHISTIPASTLFSLPQLLQKLTSLRKLQKSRQKPSGLGSMKESPEGLL